MTKVIIRLGIFIFLMPHFSKAEVIDQSFYNKVAFLESSSNSIVQNYQVKNSLGYLGKYQFSKRTLAGLGFAENEIEDFLYSPQMQEKAMVKLTRQNARILFRSFQLKEYVGQQINGIVITKRGMLAAAHLLGPYAVKQFLRSNGLVIKSDGYDTPITKYLAAFQSTRVYDDASFLRTNSAKNQKTTRVGDIEHPAEMLGYLPKLWATNTPQEFIKQETKSQAAFKCMFYTLLLMNGADVEQYEFTFSHPLNDLSDLLA